MRQKNNYQIFRYRVVSLFLLMIILCFLISLLVKRSFTDQFITKKDHETKISDGQHQTEINKDSLDSVYLCNKDYYDNRRILFCTMAPDMEIFDRHPPKSIDAFFSVMRKTRNVNMALFWADNIEIGIAGESGFTLEDEQRMRYEYRALAFEMGKKYMEAVECYKIYYKVNNNKINELLPPRILYFMGKDGTAAKRYVKEIHKLPRLLQMESLDERGRIDDFCQDIFWNKYDVPEPFESFEEYSKFIKDNVPSDVETKENFTTAIKLLDDLIKKRNTGKLKCIGPYSKHPYNGYFQSETQQ